MSNMPEVTPELHFGYKTPKGTKFSHTIYNTSQRPGRYFNKIHGFAFHDRVLVVDGVNAGRTGYVINYNGKDFVRVCFDVQVEYEINPKIKTRDCVLIPWPGDEDANLIWLGDGSVSAGKQGGAIIRRNHETPFDH